ncbi:MAG: helix-turn-helix transcriptional regulator [Oscillospiraceae bacterium]|nr:helix-turn-helix transcriptional regulator [Oscillospiraceae bacterium]
MEQRDLEQLQAEYQALQYDAAVRGLLRGSSREGFDADRFARETGVRFIGTCFVAAEFEDDPRYPAAPPAEDGRTPVERYRELRDIVLSVLGRECPAVLCNQNGRMCCILNWPDREADWHRKFTALASEMNAVLLERLGFCFQCVVSRMVSGIEGLPQAERELEQARAYRRLMGGLPGELLFYDGILHADSAQPAEEHDEVRNQAFLRALLHGDVGRSKEIFHEVIAENFVTRRPAVQFVQLRMFSVIDYFLKSLTRAAEELGLQRELERLYAPARLMQAQSVIQMEEIADALLDELREYMGGQEQFSPLAVQIRDYIRESYADPDCNVNQLSERFGITPTYATRLFKRQFGMGISACIQRNRIEQAKRLLAGGATVKEAAQRTGYSSAATFIRAYKRQEGHTPTQTG